jgi:hypothetical protein
MGLGTFELATNTVATRLISHHDGNLKCFGNYAVACQDQAPPYMDLALSLSSLEPRDVLSGNHLSTTILYVTIQGGVLTGSPSQEGFPNLGIVH